MSDQDDYDDWRWSDSDKGAAPPRPKAPSLPLTAHPLYDPHVPNWMDRGLCSLPVMKRAHGYEDHDPYGDTFFPVNGSSEYAKSICRRCPVRKLCAEYALDMTRAGDNPEGIWGGLTKTDRREMTSERNTAA